MNNITPTFEENCKLFNYTPKGRPLNNQETAELLGFKPNTLDQKRFAGSGPRYFQPKGSRRVLYSEVDILEWLVSGARESTSQQNTTFSEHQTQ